MDEVTVTPLKQIHNPKGDIYHALKKSDDTFIEFGEAYFSTINQDDIKGWKKHTQMTLNLIVPIGEIKFVIYNDNTKEFFTINLSQNNYKRLTVRPNVWMGFKGIGKNNILLNVASIEHNPLESENVELESILYEW